MILNFIAIIFGNLAIFSIYNSRDKFTKIHKWIMIILVFLNFISIIWQTAVLVDKIQQIDNKIENIK